MISIKYLLGEYNKLIEVFTIKKFGEDVWRIVFLIIVVLLILFIGYSFDNGIQKTEDMVGKAIELFAKQNQKESQQKQIKPFYEESDIVDTANTGFNPFVRGKIEYYGRDSIDSSNLMAHTITKIDHCKNKQMLIEYSCENYQKNNQELFSIVNCELGCDEQLGVCKTQ